MKPEDLFYIGEYDKVTGLDSDGREALGVAFFDVIGNALKADPTFRPDADVASYSRTTAKPGRVRQDDVWQPYQAESATEARLALYELGCTAQPFSVAASEALMTRGTDASVPSDLSGLPDNGDGSATV